MPSINAQDVFSRLRTQASNSSHFVWLLADFQFALTLKNEWVFAYQKIGSVTLMVLEPLKPTPTPFTNEEFQIAWKEFCLEVQPRIVAWVAVYTPFRNLLLQHQFSYLKIGHEPWMTLENCMPKGKTAKGVRAARNQAIRAGVTVQEWSGVEVQNSPDKQKALSDIFQSWLEKHILHMDHFLNASNPLAFAEARCYFVALSQDGEIQGYLIASPIGETKKYFLEDLILTEHFARGTGELLTLQAMELLKATDIKEVSLGVISVSNLDANDASNLPRPIAWVSITIPKLIRTVYNFDGLEIFRKRFKPSHWDPLYLCVQDQRTMSSSSTTWIKAFLAITLAFKPRLKLKLESLVKPVFASLARYPFSSSFLLIACALFYSINEGKDLPPWAIQNLSFSASAPHMEWFYRTFSSDFLFFNRAHFLILAPLHFFTLRWMEKTNKLLFCFYLLLASYFLDDFVNYYFIIKPFHFLKEPLYHQFIAYHDVGPSLTWMVLVGYQMNLRMRKYRELAFVVLVIAMLLGTIFTTLKFTAFVLNVNHVMFLLIGFAIGRLKFEQIRKQSKLMAKKKPPQMTKRP